MLCWLASGEHETGQLVTLQFSAIVQNQNYFTYWMNFDTGLDSIPLLLWVFSLIAFLAPVGIRIFE